MKLILILMLILNVIVTIIVLKGNQEATVSKKEIVYIPIKEIVYITKPINQYQEFEVTAYTAGFESTGKRLGHDAYGITASGEMAVERITLACPQSFQFGTKMYIPAFDTVFTCQDRGSAIGEGKLDVYMQDLTDAQMFGRQNLEVYVLQDNLGND
jgi:3D (Asp-Asp-Asp) domain-containing protein